MYLKVGTYCNAWHFASISRSFDSPLSRSLNCFPSSIESWFPSLDLRQRVKICPWTELRLSCNILNGPKNSLCSKPVLDETQETSDLAMLAGLLGNIQIARHHPDPDMPGGKRLTMSPVVCAKCHCLEQGRLVSICHDLLIPARHQLHDHAPRVS